MLVGGNAGWLTRHQRICAGDAGRLPFCALLRLRLNRAAVSVVPFNRNVAVDRRRSAHLAACARRKLDVPSAAVAGRLPRSCALGLRRRTLLNAWQAQLLRANASRKMVWPRRKTAIYLAGQTLADTPYISALVETPSISRDATCASTLSVTKRIKLGRRRAVLSACSSGTDARKYGASISFGGASCAFYAR